MCCPSSTHRCVCGPSPLLLLFCRREEGEVGAGRGEAHAAKKAAPPACVGGREKARAAALAGGFVRGDGAAASAVEARGVQAGVPPADDERLDW